MNLKKLQRVRLVTILFSALLVTTTSVAKSETVEEDVRDLFDQLNETIQSGDIGSIMKFYDRTDNGYFERISHKYQNWLSQDDFQYTHRVNHIEARGNEATAVIFQEITYTHDDRSTSEITWLTTGLRERGGRWIITAEEERLYAEPKFTDLSLELDPGQGTIRGKATIEIEIIEPHEDNILLKLNRGLTVASITGIKDADIDYERHNLAVIVPWHTSFNAGDTFSITVHYDGSFFNETEERGYSQVHIGPRGSFASWVTDWYPRLSAGRSKSKGRISYLVPRGLTVASSGALVKTETVDDRERHVFEVNAPLDYSFGAANYFHHEESVDDIVIGVYFLKGGGEKAKLYVSRCAEIIRYLKKLYGMYPYDSYSIVELPSDVTGNLGGSSEQGMNLYPVGILAEDKFNLPLFAHEIGHSWWGNWVQSADLTIIDEGLAQMTAVFCVQEFMGEETMRDFLKNGFSDYPQSASMYFQSINVADLELGIPRIGKEAALHQLADTKGHFVYNMLRERIGHDAFVTALRNTIRQYALTRIDLRALIKEFENTSGKDLKGFFDQWFYRRGVPEFRFNYEIEPRNGDYEIRGELRQLRDTYDVEAEISLVHEREKEIRKITIADEAVNFDFLVPFRPDTVLFDPDYKILRWSDEFRYLPLFGEGVNLRVNGRNEEAIEKLVQFLDRMPNHMEGHYQVARAYQDIDNLEEARQHYEQVVGAYEATKSYHWSVSWSYVRLVQIDVETGRPEGARSLYDKVLSLPDVMGAHGEARNYLEGE